jgi:hypothetical protein
VRWKKVLNYCRGRRLHGREERYKGDREEGVKLEGEGFMAGEKDT